MQRTKMALTALALMSAQHVFAVSHLVEIAWNRDGAFGHGASIEPGKFVEICSKLVPGDSIRWEFAAAVDFNVHCQVGKEVEFPARQAQVTSGQDTLRVAVREDYCWMGSSKASGLGRSSVWLQRQR